MQLIESRYVLLFQNKTNKSRQLACTRDLSVSDVPLIKLRLILLYRLNIFYYSISATAPKTADRFYTPICTFVYNLYIYILAIFL